MWFLGIGVGGVDGAGRVYSLILGDVDIMGSDTSRDRRVGFLLILFIHQLLVFRLRGPGSMKSCCRSAFEFKTATAAYIHLASACLAPLEILGYVP